MGPTIFPLIIHCFFSEQNSLEPARILDFLASDSICKYQNRQTNLLNFETSYETRCSAIYR